MRGNRRSSAWALMMAVALATGGLACGTSAASLCDEYCECEGCSDNELDECIDEIEDDERRADNEGCLDQYDELLACYDSEAECRDGDDFDFDGCEPEERDLSDCLD